jgi:hypothetical protein
LTAFIVVGTDTYLAEIAKWSITERKIAEKIPQKLAISPFTGDPLRYPFLREKRVGGRRVYYLIYEDLALILLVAVSGKKDQQATINHIVQELGEFRKVAEDVTKQVS